VRAVDDERVAGGRCQAEVDVQLLEREVVQRAAAEDPGFFGFSKTSFSMLYPSLYSLIHLL
jgi:hypothetical protein